MKSIHELIAELCPNGVEYLPISDCAVRLKGTPITASQMKALDREDGDVVVYAGGQTVARLYRKDYAKLLVHKGPAVIVKSRGHVGFAYTEEHYSHKAELWSYKFNEGINPKFVFYYLQSRVHYFDEVARAYSVKLPQIGVGVTDTYRIPIPPLEVQQEIVRILDEFTQLQAELEAELEARRQQYEYYRDQLLTFPEIDGGGV